MIFNHNFEAIIKLAGDAAAMEIVLQEITIALDNYDSCGEYYEYQDTLDSIKESMRKYWNRKVSMESKGEEPF